MSPYQKDGAKAIPEYLKYNNDCETCHLWMLCEIADEAARHMGMKKAELYSSIYSYQCLLPKGTKTGQVGTDTNSMFSVFNPFYEGKSQATTVIPMPGVFDIGVDTYSNGYSENRV